MAYPCDICKVGFTTKASLYTHRSRGSNKCNRLAQIQDYEKQVHQLQERAARAEAIANNNRSGGESDALREQVALLQDRLARGQAQLDAVVADRDAAVADLDAAVARALGHVRREATRVLLAAPPMQLLALAAACGAELSVATDALQADLNENAFLRACAAAIGKVRKACSAASDIGNITRLAQSLLGLSAAMGQLRMHPVARNYQYSEHALAAQACDTVLAWIMDPAAHLLAMEVALALPEVCC